MKEKDISIQPLAIDLISLPADVQKRLLDMSESIRLKDDSIKDRNALIVEQLLRERARDEREAALHFQIAELKAENELLKKANIINASTMLS